MLSIYLSFAFSLLRVSLSTAKDPSMYLCETLIDGDVCNEKGMAAYVTYDDPPTRPSRFYPISTSRWTFSEANVLQYLGVSSSDVPNISGKFSGVFIPSKSGIYTFKVNVDHVIVDGACHFNMWSCPVFIEANLSYSGTGVSHGGVCSVGLSWKCNLETQAYASYLLSTFYFEAGNRYPLFVGLHSNWTVPQAHSLYMRLYYTDPDGITKMITDDALVGFGGYTDYSSSSSASRSLVSISLASVSSEVISLVSSGSNVGVDSEGNSSLTIFGSKKTSSAVIGGVCAGITVVVAISAVALRVVLRKMDKEEEPPGSGAVDCHEDSNESGRSETCESSDHSSHTSSSYSIYMRSLRRRRSSSDDSGNVRIVRVRLQSSSSSSHQDVGSQVCQNMDS